MFPPEIKGLIVSYLTADEILGYMKASDKLSAQILKFSRYITLDKVVIKNIFDVIYFTNMKVLRLDLRHMDIRDEKLKLVLFCIKRIDHINIQYATALTNKGLKLLRNIASINLSGCYVNVSDCTLKNFDKVISINISDCHNISNEGLKYLKNIQTIDISSCHKITDEGLKHLENAKTIILDSNKITNEGLRHLANAHYIKIRDCTQINDDGLKYLKNIDTIYLYYLNNISDAGIKYLKNVRNLKLYYLKNLTDECLGFLENIEVLEINYCKNITSYGISMLVKKRPNLKWYMEEIGNNKINDETFFDTRFTEDGH
jgi:hypothetical protein